MNGATMKFVRPFGICKEGFGTFRKTLCVFFLEHCSCVMVVSPKYLVLCFLIQASYENQISMYLDMVQRRYGFCCSVLSLRHNLSMRDSIYRVTRDSRHTFYLIISIFLA
jgi:hypothetical protein